MLVYRVSLRRCDNNHPALSKGRRLCHTSPLQTILTHQKDGVGWITLNRPKQLNALSSLLLTELTTALTKFDNDAAVKCIILTGGENVFSGGADIKEMANQTYAEVRSLNPFSGIDNLHIRKPIIAAVGGLALGGGCELAMYCDIVIASETAEFGQCEIKLGTIPGMGGTQRLPRAIGKAKAMEWILTGEFFPAKIAEQAGLVSRVVPSKDLLMEAEKLALRIASMSSPVVALAKEMVNQAYEPSLRQGVNHERELFYSTFALKDKTEGMNAFVQKRTPKWSDE